LFFKKLGVMAAEARRNDSAYLKVCTPQEVQWKPLLRHIPSRHHVARKWRVTVQSDNEVENSQNK